MTAAGLDPDPWQRRLLIDAAAETPSTDVYVLTSRQAGKSTAAAALAAWLAWQRPGLMIMIVSPTMRQSVELGRKIRGLLQYVPVRITRAAEMAVHLATGSRVECLPGRPEAVRGYSPDLIVADEAAWISDELYTAISPARARTGGRLVALSTPGAATGWFHSGWTSTSPSISRIRVPWTEVGALSSEIVEAERALMPAARWRAEFECEFVSSAGQIFDVELLRSCQSADLDEWMTRLSTQ